MKIELTGIKQITLDTQAVDLGHLAQGWIAADVSYCAICRTDAKLWTEGHRDLVLPRVPGHEMVVRYKDANYTVWAGTACGTCEYCLSGDENLCDDMEIIGFHLNGGFSNKIALPKSSLVALPQELKLIHGTFAEPAGCVMNAFRKLDLQYNERILIIGGGTVGLLAAAMAKAFGAKPTVLEKNEAKIKKSRAFQDATGISVVKETHESKFQCVMNACADPVAMMAGITRLAKAGRFVHFSGLYKNENLETNLLNLIHYKEFRLSGSYGHTKEDLKQGLEILLKIAPQLDLLIEDTIAPQQVIDCLQDVIDAKVYKYVIDFSNAKSSTPKTKTTMQEQDIKKNPSDKILDHLGINKISPLDEGIKTDAQVKIDHKTKPLGALGTLETLAVQASVIQKSLKPQVKNKALFVFAADHGIAEEGVSAFPQEVTGQMVENFLNDGAAINVLCKHNDIDISIVDAGVKCDLVSHPKLITKSAGKGTQNFALQNAMTEEQAYKALQAGVDTFNEKNTLTAIDILGLGEMGIANTTTATAIISAISQHAVKNTTGRGTGVDNQALEHKIKVIQKALSFHSPKPDDAIDILVKIGGFEIAAMAGAALAAASQGCIVVLDGLISTAAGLIAYLIEPNMKNYFVSGHKSVEQGHIYALDTMELTPVLDLNMRLGEGTGAALTINLIEAATMIMCDMASFDEAGVSSQGDN